MGGAGKSAIGAEIVRPEPGTDGGCYKHDSPGRPDMRFWTLGLLLLAASCGGEPLQPAQAARPNVIVILSDDMGYSDLGCYGGEIKTPHLDALARGGLRFTQFYNTARCCPTRASLLTGLYSHQAGVGHMVEDLGHDA